MKTIMAAVLLAGFLLAAPTVKAADKIAYVNTQTVFDKTKLGQKYQGIVKEYYGNRKKILDSDVEEIQKLQEEFEKQKSVMNEKARKEKENTIKQKMADFEKKRSEFNTEIGKKNDELSREFDQTMMAILKDIAKKEKLTLVLNRMVTVAPQADVPVILYAEDGLDITEKVIAEMDKKFGAK